MSTDPAALQTPALPVPAGRSARLDGVLRVLGEESATLLLLAVYLCTTLALIPDELVQDSWLTLLSGREVVESGLPREDTLTAWTLGREWIDQQWLAQAGAYGLWLVGGVELVSLAHVAILVLTLAGAIVAARSLGGSRQSVTLVAAATLLVAPWGLQLRSQTLALPLFVALLWILAADSRAPSRRVYLVLPLLAVWANVHGTVVLGALLVGLRALTVAFAGLRGRQPVRTWLPRAAALGTLPFACLVASPYGLDLFGYYRSLFLNPMLKSFIGEWQASTPSALTAIFYCLAFAGVWLLARHRSRLTGFEAAALLALTIAGLLAIRSIVWFALAALLLMPRLLDGEWVGQGRPVRGRLQVALGLLAVVTCVAAVTVTATQPESWRLRHWSAEGAARVAALAEERPEAMIFSDDTNADWLLWRHPELAGRIAQDVRFELFESKQFLELDRLRKTAGDWQSTLAGYDVLALDTVRTKTLIDAAVAHEGFTRVWRGERLTVLVRR
jgi:hypothetical protein